MYGKVYNLFAQINWLTAASIGFLLGVLVASFFSFPEIIILIIISLAPFAVLVFRKNRYVKILILMLLFFAVGFLYFNFQPDIPKDSKDYYQTRQHSTLQVHYVGGLKGLENKLNEGLDKALLPPHSSLYKAMILGDKTGITYDMRQALGRAGLSHIIAVSGMHIAIFTLLLFWILLRFVERKYASIIAIFILIFYILMIGAPASAVRAGIMAAVIVLAQLVGRPNSTLRALLYAATAMVIASPIIVRFDIGFQLSFSAVLGILLFYKRLDYFFKKTQYKFVEFIIRPIRGIIPNGLSHSITKDRMVATYFAETKFGFTTLLAITLCAQAFTFPLVLYYFDVFSVVSPITNLLVVPALPFILISGFIAAIFGALNFFPALFAAPAWLFSSYVWGVINLFS